MQPRSTWSNIRRIATKETTLFFTTPVAYLFIAAFGAVCFFAIFWGEAFFARNIADVRPLFEWMPLLLIFLSSALTMKMWSEERRAGTLEHILTTPVPLWHFVLGKFLACLILLLSALAVTIPFPLTVSFLGDLDWGPVLAGYLATVLLGASYTAIGLFVSALSANQIISLLGSVALSGLFYLLGAQSFTSLFSQEWVDVLNLLGTSSRFESITRGVLDPRDLAYYLGLTLTFLSLNAYALETERWSLERSTDRQSDWKIVTSLIVANALGLNLWLGQLSSLRVDVTRGQQYSLSPATLSQLDGLQEPLLIRGYFSGKTHPLLAPLTPQLKDLLKEYAERSRGKVRVEFVDPQTNAEMEQEAKESYGLQPVPFQIADRHQASVVSSYFHVLIKYGDSYEVLGFKELIEAKGQANDPEVHLRNPEYDVTKSIKKVVDEYQKGGKLLENLTEPVELQILVSKADALPQELREFRQIVVQTSEELQKDAKDKLTVVVSDPDIDQKGQDLAKKYGLKPMASSLVGNDRFYFYILLGRGDKVYQIPFDDLSEGSFERNFQSTLKRFGSGFATTVSLAVDNTDYRALTSYLEQEFNVEAENLEDGAVSGSAQVLLLLKTKELKATELFAIDQFLMRGGTVLAATSPFKVDLNQALKVEKLKAGLFPWLEHFGIKLGKSFVLDERCAALPLPVMRNVGGYQIQEVRMLEYPYFLDLRPDGFTKDLPLLAEIGQLTMSWASPITTDNSRLGTRSLVKLLQTSVGSWTSPNTDLTPRLGSDGGPTVLRPKDTETQTVGVVMQGQFTSYFESEDGKKLLENIPSSTNGVLAQSPDWAKLVVLSSNTMFSDTMLGLLSGVGTGDSQANFSLIANTIDWASQDESLMTIRSRSHFKRTLYPLEESKQRLWEYINYLSAMLILVLIAGLHHLKQSRSRAKYNHILGS